MRDTSPHQRTAQHSAPALQREEWYPLTEVVGLMYHTLTSPEAEADAINGFADQVFAHTVTLSELRAHNAFAKRLDTYIFNQGESTYRGLTELITNGIDASERLIGRFGVGFLQSLAFLEEEGDILTVNSSKKDAEPVCVRFRRGTDGFEVSFISVNQNASEREGHGTSVTLTKASPSQSFAKEIEAYTRNLVEGCHLATISINEVPCKSLSGYKLIGNPLTSIVTPDVEVTVSAHGFTVHDYGRGMDSRDVRTKLLIPKCNDVTESHTAFDPSRTAMLVPTSNENGPARNQDCDVRIQVSGILVEKLSLRGLNLPPSCIIELPPGTWLPESRNQVQLNHQDERD